MTYITKVFTSNDGHKFILPVGFESIREEIERFSVRNDDVWLLGIPKSGTTWATEMIWCIGNNLDFERSKNIPIDDKYPCVEQQMHIEYRGIESIDNSLNFCKNYSSPRFIKCHLPWPLLPKQLREEESKAKSIYIHRNPRDVIISLIDFLKNMNFDGKEKSLEDWCEEMYQDKLIYGPYWDNLNTAFEAAKANPHLLVISYEEMKADLASVIRKTATHMGVDLSEEQVNSLKDHLSLKSMKENKSVAVRVVENKERTFISKGTAGRYKEIMSPELIERFDKWEKQNKKF